MTYLRDKKTDKKMFRELLNEITVMLAYEASKNLPLTEVEVQTPLETTKSKILTDTALAIIPILRAGLGMVDALQDLLPIAKVGHIGLYRNEESLEPVEYYKKLPKDISKRNVFIVDPMLATGGSLSSAIKIIKEENPQSITVLSIIAAPEGISKIMKDHPDIDLYIAKVDRQLNENGYILPGLGDAGDRLFGTL
jgi:uracil phosphoribosyltransferase